MAASSDSYSIRLTRRAKRNIEAADAWWTIHRPAAPGAVLEELARAFRLLQQRPGIGRRVDDPGLPDLRRIYLPRIRYRLYYRVVSGDRRIDVLALWHASRDGGPPP